MDLNDIMPFNTTRSGLRPVPDFAWLGRRRWCKYEVTNNPNGTYNLKATTLLEGLRDVPGYNEHYRAVDCVLDIPEVARDDPESQLLLFACADVLSSMVAYGPKAFKPTNEQWESLGHVNINLTVPEFSTPYEALAIDIPLSQRIALAKEEGWNIKDAPTTVYVVHHDRGQEGSVLLVWCGSIGTKNHVFSVFYSAKEGETIEHMLGERCHSVLSTQYHRTVTRVALNLCLMLTHFGHRLVDAPKKQNRRERRAHQHHGDWQTILLKQDVTIREPARPTVNPAGSGTGIEVRPHWRRGHWRCYPGCAVKRAAGEQVPLLFVRPCLVRPDRVSGDLSETSATYHGG